MAISKSNKEVCIGRGTEDKILANTKKDGLISIAVDTGNMYVDYNNKRLYTNQIKLFDTEAALLANEIDNIKLGYVHATKTWYDMTTSTPSAILNMSEDISGQVVNELGAYFVPSIPTTEEMLETSGTSASKIYIIDKDNIPVEEGVTPINSEYMAMLIKGNISVPLTTTKEQVSEVVSDNMDDLYDELESMYATIDLADVDEFATNVEAIQTMLDNYYTKSNTYNKAQVDSAIATVQTNLTNAARKYEAISPATELSEINGQGTPVITLKDNIKNYIIDMENTTSATVTIDRTGISIDDIVNFKVIVKNPTTVNIQFTVGGSQCLWVNNISPANVPSDATDVEDMLIEFFWYGSLWYANFVGFFPSR